MQANQNESIYKWIVGLGPIVFFIFIVDDLIKSSPYINTDVELSVGKVTGPVAMSQNLQQEGSD